MVLLKLLLLYLTMLCGGIVAFQLGGGWQGLTGTFPLDPWFQPFRVRV
jgi:hypothetical protein